MIATKMVIYRNRQQEKIYKLGEVKALLRQQMILTEHNAIIKSGDDKLLHTCIWETAY